jgi:UDP-3-O-[3-hydroxymyristoyl] glucosamine N-acyltransferase
VASYRLDELAQRVGGVVRGNPQRLLSGVATLEDAGADDLSFLTNRRYREAARRSAAGALLVARGTDLGGRDLLEVEEPYPALARILELYHPPPASRPGVSPDASVAEDVLLGESVTIEPFAVVAAGCDLGDRVVVGAGAVVGAGCRIGSGTELRPGVVLYPGTEVGSRCLLHSGVVLGADGYGFATSGGRHIKIRQVGKVVVEDDVEIGANSCVDRAMLGETRIGEGSKIDDLVMVAHGVRLGAHALLAAQAGIAGSSRLGRHATLAGQAGVAGHLKLGDEVIVAAKSAVFADIDGRSFVAGIPAVDHRRWKRSQSIVQKLPKLREELRRLAARIAELERRLDEEG